MSRITAAAAAWVVGILVWTSVGCNRDPAALKAGHIAQAERYAAEGHYPEAVIEYRNAIKIDPADAGAYHRLGVVYLTHNPIAYAQPAFAALSKAAELDPGLIDAQLKLGELFLLGRQTEAAEAKAKLILDADPTHAGGLILRARSALGAKRWDQAAQAVDAAKRAHPNDPQPWITEASIAIERHEYVAAERAYIEAGKLAPDTVGPVVGLGDAYRLQNRRSDAETQYRKAVKLQPENLALHVNLARFYAASGDLPRAEAVFQEAVGSLTKDPGARMAYAQYLQTVWNFEGAAEQYRLVFQAFPKDSTAKKSLVDLALDLGKLDEASSRIDELKAEHRSDPDVLYLTGRLLTARNEMPQAVAVLQDATKAAPDHAPAHRALGQAYGRQGDLRRAKTAVMESLKLQPESWETRLTLADLHLRSGAPDLALEEARVVLADAPRHPLALQLAGDALFQRGKLPEALQHYEALVAVAPDSSSGYFRTGEVFRATQELSKAETRYRLALDRAPGSPEVLTRLVGLLLRKKTSAAAVRLIEEQLEKGGRQAPLHQLLGQVYLTIDEPARAEEHLQRAIALDKNLPAAYAALGELYTRQRHPEKVIAQYQAMAAAAPTLPAPHMLLGTTYESQGRDEDAMAEYELALKLDPHFAPAANNLAWLYSQRGQNLDRALDLAQTAMERLPENPHVSDTLGWIYYQKGAYLKAVSLLQDSARRLPDHALVRYHLGMAYAKHGDVPAAARELAAALTLDPAFSGAQDAKQTLAALKKPA